MTATTADHIIEECRVLGVDVVSLKQSFDSTLPAGRLTFQVPRVVAEFEREMLRERVKAGMNQARRAGTHIGRPPRRRLIPIEIEEIRLLRSQGKSVRHLAKEFGASQWMIARLESTSYGYPAVVRRYYANNRATEPPRECHSPTLRRKLSS
jgi:DNA invertase Pin-like site-specific DNA recombinase